MKFAHLRAIVAAQREIELKHDELWNEFCFFGWVQGGKSILSDIRTSRMFMMHCKARHYHQNKHNWMNSDDCHVKSESVHKRPNDTGIHATPAKKSRTYWNIPTSSKNNVQIGFWIDKSQNSNYFPQINDKFKVVFWLPWFFSQFLE